MSANVGPAISTSGRAHNVTAGGTLARWAGTAQVSYREKERDGERREMAKGERFGGGVWGKAERRGHDQEGGALAGLDNGECGRLMSHGRFNEPNCTATGIFDIRGTGDFAVRAENFNSHSRASKRCTSSMLLATGKNRPEMVTDRWLFEHLNIDDDRQLQDCTVEQAKTCSKGLILVRRDAGICGMLRLRTCRPGSGTSTRCRCSEEAGARGEKLESNCPPRMQDTP
jgi:hypothetical protein